MAIELGTPAPLEAGHIIDGFLLGECLHQGEQSVLWSVTEVNKPRQQALIMKVPRLTAGEDPVAFEIERMLLPRLSGPHVPRLVARGDFNKQPYLVMERIGGDTLQARLIQTPWPVDQVAQLGARVAQALHALHCQHVVHLNVRPSHLMFRDSGEAVLLDFGLSRHDQLPDLLEGLFALPRGSGPSLSPEQILLNRTDPRSDLFALGVMLFHLATGTLPFGPENTLAGLRKRLYTDPTPPRALRPDLPAWFQEVVLHCLEVRPEDRYQTAAQLALDLNNPDQIVLTGRAQKLIKAGPMTTFGRWVKTIGTEPKGEPSGHDPIEHSPILMVAMGLHPSTPELQQKLLSTVRRILLIEPGARLACVSVFKRSSLDIAPSPAPESTRLAEQHLVALKHWARPLQQALATHEQRLTFHVLESQGGVASTLVAFANQHQVDHIVIGAHGHSTVRRYLGGVSAQVVTEAECSVTVVRV